MNEPLLTVEDLHVRYTVAKTVTKALTGISLSLNKGESLGLVGETGAGKTTLAKSIMRIIQCPPGEIKSGDIRFEGESLLAKSNNEMEKIRGFKISMIFQDPMTALNPVRTVGDQIAEVIGLHNRLTKREVIERTKEMMRMVGIDGERYYDYPHQFSGGMKQRIVIAIALACRPMLLIADEPTTALDVTIQAQMMQLIENLKKELNTSLLLITHDLGIVAESCDKVAIIYAGEIVEYGTLEHIFNRTMHPYSKGLFNSIPNFSQKVRRLKPINGLMPDPTNLADGCKFADRCQDATDACRAGTVCSVEVEPGHFVRCRKYYQEEV